MKKMKWTLCLVCAGVICTLPAYAYTDPSVTSTILQAVVALVVVAGAVIGTFVRKARKKAREVLNIDENAGKTVEDDLVVFDDNTDENTK